MAVQDILLLENPKLYKKSDLIKNRFGEKHKKSCSSKGMSSFLKSSISYYLKMLYESPAAKVKALLP